MNHPMDPDEGVRKETDAAKEKKEQEARETPRETSPDRGAREEPHRPMTIQEAARKGGQTTKQRYGPDFYSRIGKKGGQRVSKDRGPDFYAEIGRKGGEARVAQSKRLERGPDEDEEEA